VKALLIYKPVILALGGITLSAGLLHEDMQQRQASTRYNLPQGIAEDQKVVIQVVQANTHRFGAFYMTAGGYKYLL
jgi:hypothetical protein